MINKKSFYLIGKFSNREIISERIKEVEILGFHNTHNWTRKENYNCPKSQQVEQDINGVKNADIVIAIIDNPIYHYRGSFAEIGCALGQNKRVYLITNNCEQGTLTHCFLFHKNIIRFNTWKGFIEFLSSI